MRCWKLKEFELSMNKRGFSTIEYAANMMKILDTSKFDREQPTNCFVPTCLSEHVN